VLQPSQVPTYILFLSFVVFLIAIFIVIFHWGLRKRISDMQKSPDFTDLDIIAVRRQMLALLIGIPLFILFVVLSPLGLSLQQPITFFIALIIGFASLAYISVSSIRNRVSIFSRASIFRRHESLPIKGTKAVWNGVIYLVFIVLVFTGFAIYFTSLK
jgi:hypothetical protein